MGIFSKLVSNFKNQTQAVFDPAGSLVRKATGNDARNARSFIDPSGALLKQPVDPRVTTQRTPYVSHLSPGAQAIKDSIAARRSARMTPGMAPQPMAPAMRPAPIAPPAPTMRISDPRMPPTVNDASGYGLANGYSDGGKVKRKVKKGYADGGRVSSKAFVRKPNGKPY